MTVKEMWEEYIEFSGKDKDTPYQAWHFCNNEKDANELAELTRSGVKRATASLLKSYEYENEPVPKVGDINIIINWEGEPICIIENEKVEILPFKDITKEHAEIEGEGDKSLEYWREGHLKFFGEETKDMGIEFNEDMEVVFQIFKVVYPK
ncbi:uncharacterized protein YhfF [Acetoanaerobium pronyense]|uniref:Uncharacterized protein YhfF n=1 Tax=Acetoanaerobium pronyense TaxID=1482736 RepID=A0ABS4KIU8_9FIRM|nr:ASCH domain-containing protein [Acetoanaerobium pronyense]MBP2027719.1 uncharacterized protein YhfF [Acetoanaerobium pronyense]